MAAYKVSDPNSNYDLCSAYRLLVLGAFGTLAALSLSYALQGAHSLLCSRALRHSRRQYIPTHLLFVSLSLSQGSGNLKGLSPFEEQSPRIFSTLGDARSLLSRLFSTLQLSSEDDELGAPMDVSRLPADSPR